MAKPLFCHSRKDIEALWCKIIPDQRLYGQKGCRIMLFTLKKFIGGMLLPLPLFLCIMAAALILLWFTRWQKAGKVIMTMGWAGLLLLSLQPVADRLLRPLETTWPTWQGPVNVNYIVVLGGGYTWDPKWAPSSNLINNSLPRVTKVSGCG
jgi:hypothetical protein